MSYRRGYGKRTKNSDFEPDSNFIAAAITDFLKRGGKIIKLESKLGDPGNPVFRFPSVRHKELAR
jgi:hypothetical protein